MIKKRNGITLIALVITIIVLLILAGVSIATVVGDNGVLTQSQKAKENTRGSEIKEIVFLAVDENELTNYSEGDWTYKTDLVEKLEAEGKITEEEADSLLGRNGVSEVDVITIGSIEIDFSVLNTDKTAPTVTLEVAQAGNYKVQVTVTSTDAESGLPENPIYNYYVKYSTTETEYPEEATYSGTESTYTLDLPTEAEDLLYDIKVTVTDNAGNIGYGEIKEHKAQVNVCFVAGTKVSTSNGLVNIEEIQIGDKVYSYNENTQQIEEQKVIDTFSYEINKIATLTFENSEQIQNTIEHPYYVVGKGWMLTEDLEIGDKVLTQDNEEIEIENIEINNQEKVKVYNITVENNHNYFVGTTKILVHNTVCCFVANTKVLTVDGFKNIQEIKVGDKVYTYNEKTQQTELQEVLATFIHQTNEITTLTFENGEQIQNTKEHPYYVVGKGWTRTKDLKIGDEVLTENNIKIKVKNIEINTGETVNVYNITTSNNHNYFVGENKYLVHNVIK